MNKAFTLIELLLVVVILAVIVSVSIPNFGSAFHSLELKRAVDRVVYTMRYARSRAITEQIFIKMSFEEGAPRLFLADKKDDEASGDYSLLKGQGGRSLNIPEKVEFRSVPKEILFYPDGKIDKTRFSMAIGEREFFISTEDGRGRVVILEKDE